MMTVTDSGVPGVGELAWGSHVCHFYESAEDVVDTLVPYFVAGLRNDEACFWVAATPLVAAEARAALSAAVPDLAAREAKRQIEILDHQDFYLRTGATNAQDALEMWVQREERVLANGYKGLRLTGNTYWLERKDWSSFMQYETLVTDAFAPRRIVALCSYCLGRCNASDVLDVVHRHNFSFARREGDWQVVEGRALRIARDDLTRVETAWRNLQELDRRKDELFAIVSHELRNPLAPIRAAVEVLKLRGATGPELSVIERQVEHMARLVDEMVDTARVTRGVINLHEQVIGIDSLLGECVDEFERACSARAQRIVTRIEPKLAVSGDRRRLHQVFTNLLSNALRFSPAGGTVTIDAHREHHEAVISVRDTGPGIDPNLLPQIFDPFVQGENALHRQQGGLGLGLSIVKTLVTLHKGSVSAASRPNEGAVFTVRLPARTMTTTVPSNSPPRTATVTNDRSRRILLVDDNIDAAEMSAEALSLLGHQPQAVHSAGEALALAERSTFDVAVVDIGLPDMDGYQLGSLLKQRFPAMAVIALTGYAQPEHRERSTQAGFAGHLVKPMDLGVLAKLLADTTPVGSA